MRSAQLPARGEPSAAWGTLRACVVIVVCGLLLTSALSWRTVTGHSYPLNLSWHEGFVAQLRSGELYPRWLNTTNQGLGAPSFYFYAPLPFLVSGLCDLLSPVRFSTAAFVYSSAAIAVTCSGLAMFAYARRCVSAESAVIAATSYMAMPYHLGIDLWWRAALGELWAFVWAPLILAGVARQWRGERWGREVVAVGWVGLIISHLPSFLIVLCGATSAGIVWYARPAKRLAARRLIVASTVSLAVAVALTGAYWFPALATLGYTDVTRFMTSGWFLYSNNFVLPYKPGSWNGTVEMLVLAELIAACALTWLAVRLQEHGTPVFRMSVACLVAAVFMMTPASDVVWRLIPPLQRVQFPWRFQILVDLALVMMLTIVIDAAPASRVRRLLSSAAPVWCLAVGLTWAVLFAPRYSDSVAQDLRATRIARADANEYRTRWTPVPFFYGVRNGDTLVSRRVDAGAVSADRNGNVHLAGSQGHPIDVVLNRFWYPSLRASAAGNASALATRPQAATGLAIVSVPAGVRELHVETALLPEERRAWALSGATAIFILLWLWRATKASLG